MTNYVVTSMLNLAYSFLLLIAAEQPEKYISNDLHSIMLGWHNCFFNSFGLVI